jgi:hypothetical protein
MYDWQKAFDMLWTAIKKYGLYKASDEIRVGIGAPNKSVIPDIRLCDDKIKIVSIGNPKEYERITLHHMRKSSESEDVLYYYLHTKGITRFGTKYEPFVINWIERMLYFNIQHWKKAVKILSDDKYDTYGCDYYNGGKPEEIFIPPHYSGNFWWAKSSHIKQLSSKIPYQLNGENYYIAPEVWVATKNDKLFCIYKSGGEIGGLNYSKIFPENEYKILDFSK